MGIFDVFNFKKKFAKIATKENFDFLRKIIKEEIKSQIKNNAKKGAEKMEAVVRRAENYIIEHMSSDNKIVQWIVDHILIKGMHVLAQSIYDDLKEVVKGL